MLGAPSTIYCTDYQSVSMSAPAPNAPMLPTSMLRYTARGVPVHCVMVCDLITLDSGALYDVLCTLHYALYDALSSCDCHMTVTPQEGVTALFLACQNGHVTTVQLLVEAGASLDVQRNVSCYPDTPHLIVWVVIFS